jgi:hypothetical protein
MVPTNLGEVSKVVHISIKRGESFSCIFGPLHNLPRIVLLMISENGCWECEKKMMDRTGVKSEVRVSPQEKVM